MSSTSPKTFLVCHGAWSAGWAWKKMHPLMREAGHRLVTPSYTGLGERAAPMPIKCFQPSLKLRGGPPPLPRSYIYATRITPADTFGQFAKMAKADPAWGYHEIDASHAPNVTAPEALMALLEKIAAA